MSTHRNSANTLPVDRIKAYALQRGIPVTGMTKNATAARKVMEKLTPAQRRRLSKKVAA